MLLNQWDDAVRGVWLPEDQVENIQDKAEKYLIGQFKLAYLTGKGRKFVPVLISVDMMDAISLLVRKRQSCGISSANRFLFPTKPAGNHCSGWHAVREVCQQAQLTTKINATRNRHFVSTIYASLHMKEQDKKVYLAHMGLEAAISTNDYQTFGFNEVKVMAPFLTRIDQGI